MKKVARIIILIIGIITTACGIYMLMTALLDGIFFNSLDIIGLLFTVIGLYFLYKPEKVLSWLQE